MTIIRQRLPDVVFDHVCIAKLRDGDTHGTGNVEHAADLANKAIVVPASTLVDKTDPQGCPVTWCPAGKNLALTGCAAKIAGAGMDKGCHDIGLLKKLAEERARHYIAERRRKNRGWSDKPAAQEQAFRANPRLARGKKGRQLTTFLAGRVFTFRRRSRKPGLLKWLLAAV
jgi:hypothetical protein